MRLFVAINIPADVRLFVTRALKQFVSKAPSLETSPKLGWEAPEKFHITLQFIGETDPQKIPDICTNLRVVAAATPAPLALKVEGKIDSFGDPGRRKVLFAPAGGSSDLDAQKLDDLVKQTRLSLASFFPKRQNAFHPHVTVGRVKSKIPEVDINLLEQALTYEASTICEYFDVNEIILYESRAGDNGTTYHSLETFTFKG